MEVVIFYLSCVIILILFILTILYVVNKIEFNNGVCRKCGNKMKYFDTDSSGANGYTCDKCDYTIWISLGVDRNFK